MGMRYKESDIKKSIIRKNTIWDRLIFKNIQEDLGGRLRLMIVGSAPLAGNVLTFARCVLSCLIVEGYGQTECAGPITLSVQVFKFTMKDKDLSYEILFICILTSAKLHHVTETVTERTENRISKIGGTTNCRSDDE
jgi:acyl-CoA synthetase (AMP-forming)/AMP-acid ligase II